MDFWNDFIEAVHWFIEPGQNVVVTPARPPGSWQSADPGVAKAFPKLCQLLSAAHLTQLTIDEQPRLLFSWPVVGAIPAWLCAPPSESPPAHLCAVHRLLLRAFGGIIERADEPDSWLLNHNDALTLREAAHDAAFLRNYAWMFPGERVPLETADYYSIAREANGNTTLCHRATGDVVLFAPDHAFDHVRCWRGLPEYTLYELKGAPGFVEFVEQIAAQWLKLVRA